MKEFKYWGISDLRAEAARVDKILDEARSTLRAAEALVDRVLDRRELILNALRNRGAVL